MALSLRTKVTPCENVSHTSKPVSVLVFVEYIGI